MTATPIESSASEASAAGKTTSTRHLRLQHRIVIAVIVVALLSSGGAAWLAVRLTSDTFQARLQAQLVGSAAAVSSEAMALNPVILRTLSGIVGAAIVTLGPDGDVLASSVDVPDPRVLVAVRTLVASRSGSTAAATAAPADCGYPCLLAVREVAGRPGTVLVLVAALSDLDSLTSSVTQTIMLSAVLSVVVLTLITQVVVRRLIVPLNRLVQFARELSPQQDRRRAEVGDDEVGELSEAFNTMLDRLEAARETALRSEKLGLAGIFAARVAHDIRNPLSSIKLQTQLAAAEHTDGELARTLGGVLRDIEQVESVVSDLMELARPGDLRLDPVALNDVVSEALQQVASQFTYRKIAVDVALAEGLPAVALDRKRFKQALLNVLVNASEALHTGGRVVVKTLAVPPASVAVEISDDGVGIPPEIIDRVFEPFVSTKREGVGLGLVNVRAVVEGHGGRISLESQPGRGTRARIVLPVKAHG
jgi:signal transduction histidine kinase